MLDSANETQINKKIILTFISITLFYFFESAQMSYFNILAPHFLSLGLYKSNQIASLSAAYYYGDMIGLIPVGFALDYFPLRKILLWAILGSIIGAFMLILSHHYFFQWAARFVCGFFGGTFSFVGGIRVLASIFKKRFTLFMGIFLSAGMFGGLLCQYPLLVAVNHIGIVGPMLIMAMFGLVVGIVNIIFLHPIDKKEQEAGNKKYSKNIFKIYLEIFKNYQNWLDCCMVVLLDTPVSIIGTLWGIILLTGFYHFSQETSALIVMTLFAGLMIGLPTWGEIADRCHYSAWIIISGAGASLLMIALMLIFHNGSPLLIAGLFFGLGLFSSCQTLGFTWITRSMKPELIGRNSAFNSMIFMGTNGGFKQIGALLLSSTPFFSTSPAVSNLLILICLAMFLAALYACIRNKLFKLNFKNRDEALTV